MSDHEIRSSSRSYTGQDKGVGFELAGHRRHKNTALQFHHVRNESGRQCPMS